MLDFHALVLGPGLHRQARGGVEQTLLRRLQQRARTGLGHIHVLDVPSTGDAPGGVHLGQQVSRSDGPGGGELVQVGGDLVVQLGLVAVGGGFSGGGEVVRHQRKDQVLVLLHSNNRTSIYMD